MPALHDIVTKGSTDRSVVVSIIDDTDGTPETGVVFNTSGIDLWYRREGAAKTSITEATLAALTTAHTDGGFLHIGDGDYRLDLPDAAFATGANYVDFGGTVTGMIVIGGRVRLVNYSLEDSVRMGMTALPNAAADAAGGLPISDAGGLDMDSISARLPAALVGGRIDATVDGTGMEAGAVTAIRDGIILRTTLRGTASGTPTTTSIPTSAMSPATSVADQLKGRIVIFDHDTTTAALRGQATDITASSASATPTLTVTALTTAPASGDTFTVV
jgi:hypothetical protein